MILSVKLLLKWSACGLMLVTGALGWGTKAYSVSPIQYQIQRSRSFQEVYSPLGTGENDRIVDVGSPIMIRVGLMVEEREISVTGRGSFVVRVGDQTFEARAGEQWKTRWISGQKARVEHLPIVGSFDFAQEAQAKELAQSWKAKGHEAEIVPTGVRLFSDDTLLSDTRRLLVRVNHYEDEGQAKGFLNDLNELKADDPSWLLERPIELQSGIVAVIDPRGIERGRGSKVSFESSQPLKVFRVHHDVGFPQEGYEDREYEGSIHIVFDKKGLLAAVNRIELDAYLRGVVPSEIYASDPADTIRAQAVAARGETLARLGTGNETEPFDICSDQNCQVYTGLKAQAQSTNEGVEATRGEVLKQDSRIVNAVYCDTCGGHSENVENVWTTSPNPSLVGVEDSPKGQSGFPRSLTEESLSRWIASSPPCFCRGEGSKINPKFRWTVELTSTDLDTRINKLYSVGSVKELVPGERGVSGRLKSLKVVGDKGEVVIRKEYPIRKALGGLNTALFVVTATRDLSGKPIRWIFRGAGWGHGVGLCQVGARWAARAGMDYKAILTHYFKQCGIVKVY